MSDITDQAVRYIGEILLTIEANEGRFNGLSSRDIIKKAGFNPEKPTYRNMLSLDEACMEIVGGGWTKLGMMFHQNLYKIRYLLIGLISGELLTGLKEAYQISINYACSNKLLKQYQAIELRKQKTVKEYPRLLDKYDQLLNDHQEECKLLFRELRSRLAPVFLELTRGDKQISAKRNAHN